MINNVTLSGFLAREVDFRKTTTNKSVASFTVACNRIGEGVDFINCQAWNASADYLSKYAAKGSKIELVGRIQVRDYNNKEGNKVYVTEVIANQVSVSNNKKGESHVNSSDTDYSGNTFDDFDTGPTLDISSDDLPF